MSWDKLRRIAGFCGACLIVVGFLLWFCRPVVVAFLISMFLSYLVAPTVGFLERKTKLKRSSVVLLILIMALGGVSFATAWLIPIIYRESLGILAQIPEAVNFIAARVEPVKQSLVDSGFIGINRLESILESLDIWENLSQRGKTAVAEILATTPDLLSALMNAALVPLLMFFVLVDLPLIRERLINLVPKSMLEASLLLFSKVDRTFKSVLKGQVIVAAILSILYMAGLSLIEMDSGLAIGFIAGICRIIPYLDVVVGIALSLVVIISGGGGLTTFLLVGFVFMAVQLVDGMLITPRIIGDRAGLHPGVVIVSVICFGYWFGFLGILLAIPAVAITKVLGENLLWLYKQSPLYRE